MVPKPLAGGQRSGHQGRAGAPAPASSATPSTTSATGPLISAYSENLSTSCSGRLGATLGKTASPTDTPASMRALISSLSAATCEKNWATSEDRTDPDGLGQTHLEQVNTNRPFRASARAA